MGFEEVRLVKHKSISWKKEGKIQSPSAVEMGRANMMIATIAQITKFSSYGITIFGREKFPCVKDPLDL